MVALAVPWLGWGHGAVGATVVPTLPPGCRRAELCHAPKVAGTQGRAETAPDILSVPSCGGGGKSQSVNVCSAL